MGKKDKKRGKRPRFRFPTSDKDALRLFRLLGDLSDLTDGGDDVDESDALTRSWLRELLAAGSTPDAATLELVAAGHDDLTDHAEAVVAGVIAVDNDGEALTWQGVARALREEESGPGLTAATVTSALANMGLGRQAKGESKAGCLIFARNKERVGVRLYQLGSIRVAEIAVGATKKRKNDDRSAILAGADDAHTTPLIPGAAGTYVAGSIVGQETWEGILGSLTDTLERAQTALQAAGDGGSVPRIPLTFEALKGFIASGKDAEDRAEDAIELAEIGKLQAKIADCWVQLHTAGRAPTSVILQYDGPDGAGKTSSSKYIPAALLSAQSRLTDGPNWTTRTEIFKAPTDADKVAMRDDAGAAFGLPKWLARHVVRGMPTKHEILIKDRYQPGDFVYVGASTEARCSQMAAENARYEKMLTDKGVLIFQAILYADRDKQAKTFGKRMARGALVDAFIEELRGRGALTTHTNEALTTVKNKVQNADFVGLASFDEVLPLYRQFAAAMNVSVIDATNRHTARLILLRQFAAALESFGQRAR